MCACSFQIIVLDCNEKSVNNNNNNFICLVFSPLEEARRLFMVSVA